LKLKNSDLVNAHKEFEGLTSLKDRLGDGFTYHRNPIYKNVRDAVIKLGYSFTPEDFCDYNTLRFKSLPLVYKHKKIPYTALFPAIERVEIEKPGCFYAAEIPLIPDFYLLHEQCHCIMNFIMTERFPPKASDDIQRQIIIPVVIGEAAAGATECMSNIYVKDEIDLFLQAHHSAFNFGVDTKPRYVQSAVLETLGFKKTWQIMFFAQLCHNFLHTKVDQKVFSRILSFVEPERTFTELQLLNILEWFQIGLTSNPIFLMKVGHFYYKYWYGIDEQMDVLLGFDFMRFFEEDPSLRAALDSYTECIESGRV
jgi:hypothetical protein